MKAVNIHDAKTHLSKLVDQAVQGEPFIIAKAGKPMVKVVALERADLAKPRIGFMKGRIKVPEAFDEMGRDDIADLFEGR